MNVFSKKRLALIKPQFLVIVPIEYKDWGIIPANWFIGALMTMVNCPYYIGSLSAAELYGATHQKSQELQAGKNLIGVKRDFSWRIYINEEVELDL